MSRTTTQLALFELPESAPVEPPEALPESLRALVAAGFPGAALADLLEAYGGTVIDIPRAPSPRLVETLGCEAAGLLTRVMGGCRFAVPVAYRARLAARNAALRRDFDGGAGVAALVRRYGITERQVWAVLGRAG